MLDLGIPRTFFDVAGAATFVVILVGVLLHKQRQLHVRIMMGCFITDLLLVVLIELQRSAVEQIATAKTGLLKFHIAVSVAAVILWVAQVVVGRKLLRGAPMLRRHRIQAWAFLLFRFANAVTAFFVGQGRAN